MRAIASSFFAAHPLLAGPVFTLVSFLAVFLYVAFRVGRARASSFEGRAALPLDSESYSERGQS